MRVESTGPRSKNAISVGCLGSVQSNTESPPWYQAWIITSRPGIGLATLPLHLVGGEAVGAPHPQPLVLPTRHGLPPPYLRIARTALRGAAAAPFVTEQELGAVVVEGGRMPVGQIGIRHRGD